MAENQVPAEFICPISQQIMRDPVLATDGQTYDRPFIEQWFQSHNTSPLTGLRLSSLNLIPNFSLKSLIDNFTSQNNVLVLNQNQPISQVSVFQDIKPQISILRKDNLYHLNVKTPSINDIPNNNSQTQISHNMPTFMVMVIDVSGSMGILCETEEETAYSRLELVKHSVKTIIKSMTNYVYMSIISFHTNIDVCSEFIQGTDVGKNQLISILDRLEPMNSTNIYGAIDSAFSLIERNNDIINGSNCIIALLTDGKSNHDPPRGVMETLKNKYENKVNATLHTFGFTYDIDYLLLDKLAQFGNGSFSFIPDFSMIGTVFVNFMGNVLNTCFYNCSLYVGSEKMNLANMHLGVDRDILFSVDDWNSCDVIFEYNGNKQIMKNELFGLIQDVNETTPYELGRIDYLNVIRLMVNMNVNDSINSYNDLMNRFNGFGEICKPLIREFNSPDKCEQEEQIKKAVSREDWKFKWGNAHILSNWWAVKNQVCNNFKDPSVQPYSDSISFVYFQKMIEEIFLTIPAPTGYNRQSGRRSLFTGASVSANTYYNNSGSCFGGSGKVLMANGSIKAVSQIRMGDKVKDLNGLISSVRCVIKTLVDRTKWEMVSVNDLWITPWHPVKLSKKGIWKFPSMIGDTVISQIDTVYNFVLEDGYSVCINGMDVVTLGHGITNDAVLAHPYFGSTAVLRDLSFFSPVGWKNGYIVMDQPVIKRDSKTNKVIGIIRRG